MKSLLSKFFIAAVIYAVSSISIDFKTDFDVTQNLEHPQKFPESPLHEQSNSCGGILNSNNGEISYKSNQQISQTERCVWVIRVDKATNYDVHLVKYGLTSINDSSVQLIGTCLQHQQNATHVLVNQEGIVRGLSDCNVLIITFHSGSNVEGLTGFILEYSGSGTSRVSSNSTDLQHSGETTIIRHPSSAATYSPFELDVFVFTPINNTYHPSARTNVVYIGGNIEFGTYDYLKYYAFNASSVYPTKWEYIGSNFNHTSNPNSDREIIVSTDLLLITFESDVSGEASGFELVYSGSGGIDCDQ